MKNTSRLFLVSAFILWFLMSAQALSITPEQRADLHLLEAQKAYKIKDYATAVKAFEAIEKLNIDMEPDFYFFYASATNNNGDAIKAYSLINRYLELTGQNGQYYQQALALYLDVEEKKNEQEAEIARLVKTLVMITIPAGSFMMGSNDGDDDEKPVHRVNVKTFKLMESEVTFAMWDACVAAGGCKHKPDDEGWGRGNRPVMNVSYDDIIGQFIPWLNRTTGQRFRLPSEAEWEYAARAGSTTQYSWGDSISCSQAHYGYYSNECGTQRGTDAVKSFKANAFGLYDMHGNVWEWTQDCWNDSYNGAPSNGSAWQAGNCSKRVLRGGSWLNFPYDLRSASRNGNSASIRYYNYGFRLAQDIQ